MIIFMGAQGQHIANLDEAFAAKLKTLVEKYKCWGKGEGIVTMDKEEHMRIHLVDGWQKMKIGAKVYIHWAWKTKAWPIRPSTR